MSAASHFSVAASWDSGAGKGRVENPSKSFQADFAGAAELGGGGGAANPEELLSASIASCFLVTWGIFLKKLGLDLPHPKLEVQCEVDKDPAGGYRVTAVRVAPEIPRALWQADSSKVERTLQLAEKYCIISKAVQSEARSFTIKPRVV